MKQKLILAIWGSLVYSSVGLAYDNVPVISEDKNGKPVIAEVSAKEYSSRYQSTVSTTSESLMQALEGSTNNNQQWLLRTITVGIAANMEFGVGTMKIAAIPKSRLIFTNSTKPYLP
ncbi:MAG: hypothetical protein ACXVCY_13205 [Pseudobdellovibrionaceae bacterium]